MILSAQSIANRLTASTSPELTLDIYPFVAKARQYKGKSFGLTAAGYDIRLGQLRHPGGDNAIVERVQLAPGKFMLAASLERVSIPYDLQVIVHDKSSWARKGLALQNTVLEPGWSGYITLELSNHGTDNLLIESGMPIAQLVFHQLDVPTVRPYTGKYQNQGAEPTFAIEAKDTGETNEPS